MRTFPLRGGSSRPSTNTRLSDAPQNITTGANLNDHLLLSLKAILEAKRQAWVEAFKEWDDAGRPKFDDYCPFSDEWVPPHALEEREESARNRYYDSRDRLTQYDPEYIQGLIAEDERLWEGM